MGLWFQPAAAKFLMCLVDAEGNEPATCGLSQSRAPAVSPDNFKCKYTYELGHTRVVVQFEFLDIGVVVTV